MVGLYIYGAFFGLGKGVFDAEYHGIYIYIYPLVMTNIAMV